MKNKENTVSQSRRVQYGRVSKQYFSVLESRYLAKVAELDCVSKEMQSMTKDFEAGVFPSGSLAHNMSNLSIRFAVLSAEIEQLKDLMTLYRLSLIPCDIDVAGESLLYT